MKYQSKSFSEFYGSKEYRDNWENIFGKKEKFEESTKEEKEEQNRKLVLETLHNLYGKK